MLRFVGDSLGWKVNLRSFHRNHSALLAHLTRRIALTRLWQGATLTPSFRMYAGALFVY